MCFWQLIMLGWLGHNHIVVTRNIRHTESLASWVNQKMINWAQIRPLKKAHYTDWPCIYDIHHMLCPHWLHAYSLKYELRQLGSRFSDIDSYVSAMFYQICCYHKCNWIVPFLNSDKNAWFMDKEQASNRSHISKPNRPMIILLLISIFHQANVVQGSN